MVRVGDSRFLQTALLIASGLPCVVGAPKLENCTRLAMTTTDSVLDDEEAKWAMIYIVAVVCMFAMGIVLLIAAQMSYHPHDSQVNRYLKQRRLLKDMKILQHMQRKRELAKFPSRSSYSQAVMAEINSLPSDIIGEEESPSPKQSAVLYTSLSDLSTLLNSAAHSNAMKVDVEDMLTLRYDTGKEVENNEGVKFKIPDGFEGPT